jgi:hypothetical protein
MEPYFDPTSRNMEDDLNIFENGRRPQFFITGTRPQFCFMQPRELISGMQHCFNPTFFLNQRRPQFFDNGR